MSTLSLMQIHALHAAASAAHHSGLLDHLVRAPASAAEAAAALELDAAAVGLILHVLRSAGLVHDERGRYRATVELARELAGPGGNAAQAERVWGGAGALLRTGRTLSTGDDDFRAATYPGVVNRLGAAFAAHAAAFGDALAGALPEGARVLDVGAGAGLWSLALLERRTDASLTGLDFETVLPRLRDAAAARGLAARLSTIAGDYEAAPVPEAAFDLVIFANVLHLEPPDRARALIDRFAATLRPGGRIAVIDALPDHTAEADRIRAAYALHLALRLPGAHPHREADVRTWLAAAGLTQVRKFALEPTPTVVAALVAGA